MAKPESAKLAISDFNEFVNVETINEFLSNKNAQSLVDRFDIIMDGLDNP